MASEDAANQRSAAHLDAGPPPPVSNMFGGLSTASHEPIVGTNFAWCVCVCEHVHSEEGGGGVVGLFTICASQWMNAAWHTVQSPRIYLCRIHKFEFL